MQMRRSTQRFFNRKASEMSVSGVENERAVKYGSISSKPVFVAGIVITAVMTSKDPQRALAVEKQADTSIHEDARNRNTVTKYQRKIVQSIERCVKRAVHARIWPKSESRSCARKNSVA